VAWVMSLRLRGGKVPATATTTTGNAAITTTAAGGRNVSRPPRAERICHIEQIKQI